MVPRVFSATGETLESDPGDCWLSARLKIHQVPKVHTAKCADFTAAESYRGRNRPWVLLIRRKQVRAASTLLEDAGCEDVVELFCVLQPSHRKPLLFCCNAEINRVLLCVGTALCPNITSAARRRRTNVTFCHAVTDSHTFHHLFFFFFLCPTPSPPSSPPPRLAFLPTSFLPRRSLSASQHIPPRAGRGGCLIRASSKSLSLSAGVSPLQSIRRPRTRAVSITYRQARVQR